MTDLGDLAQRLSPPAASGLDQRVELDVSGMTCAACAARIEKKLNKLPGVTATVNYATERAVVLGLPPERAPEAVKTVVDDAIRQVMDVRDGNGKANTTVIQMLGSMSETLAAPMNNFTHWVAVTMNVYLNFIDHCIKHYEMEGV